MRRRFEFLLVLCFLIVMLIGCKDIKEIDRVTFPVVLGIDWNETENNIEIYAQVSTISFQPGGQSQSAAVYTVLEGKGKTLKDAMDNVIDHAQQYISWKQIVAVVFTEKMAKRGVYEELDVLSRNEQIHLNSYLILTTENLKDLLGSSPVLETGLPTTIVGVGLISEQSTHSKVITMKDFIVANLNKETVPVLPLITIYQKEKTQNENKIELDYKGLGVFKEDKLVGWLDEKETISLLFVSGIQNQGSFTLIQSKDTREGEITVSEHTSKTKFIPFIKNNKPGISLKISVEYDIYSYFTKEKIDIKEVQRINSLVSTHIKNDVEAVVNKAQHELKADIFGFGGKIYRKYPHYWTENMNHWSEIFSSIDVMVEVEAKLRDTGQLTDSFKY